MKKFRIPATFVACAVLALFLFAGHGDAAPAAGNPPCQEMHKSGAKHGCNCDCDCCMAGCPEGKGCGCGHNHGGHEMAPMMEGMKKHAEEVRKSIAALRAHEKQLEGIADPAEFRKAAIEHFRMIDDLQESHLKHMESMAGGGKHGHRLHGEGCKDCPGKHAPCPDCPKK